MFLHLSPADIGISSKYPSSLLRLYYIHIISFTKTWTFRSITDDTLQISFSGVLLVCYRAACKLHYSLAEKNHVHVPSVINSYVLVLHSDAQALRLLDSLHSQSYVSSLIRLHDTDSKCFEPPLNVHDCSQEPHSFV